MYQVATALNGVAATTTSAVLDIGRFSDDITMEVLIVTGTPTISVQLQGSIDNSDFVALGSAITAAGVAKITGTNLPACRYFKVVGTMSGTAGTLTVKLGFLEGE